MTGIGTLKFLPINSSFFVEPYLQWGQGGQIYFIWKFNEIKRQ